MITRFLGWVLIFLQFFTKTIWREQIIAMQTIFCAATANQIQPYHLATATLIVILSADPISTDMTKFILFHITVLSAVYIEYRLPSARYVSRTAVVWIIRWLGSCNDFYSDPVRSCTKCLVYIIIANFRLKYLNANFYKCIWIITTHEICLLILPIQLLREIYLARPRANARKKNNHVLTHSRGKKDIFIV